MKGDCVMIALDVDKGNLSKMDAQDENNEEAYDIHEVGGVNCKDHVASAVVVGSCKEDGHPAYTSDCGYYGKGCVLIQVVAFVCWMIVFVPVPGLEWENPWIVIQEIYPRLLGGSCFVS